LAARGVIKGKRTGYISSRRKSRGTVAKHPRKNDLTVPKMKGDDVAYALVKGLISQVPGVGGTAAEFMQVLFAPPIERRRDEWMKRMAATVMTLMSRGLTFESLQNNDEFISAMQQAAQIAQRSHQEEKLVALRNALMNIALDRSPNEAMRTMFLKYIDDFTEWHIRILRVYQRPEAHAGMTELFQVVEHAYPSLRGQSQFYDRIWHDLLQRGLVDMQNLHGAIANVTSITKRRTTDLGVRFMRFIEEPDAPILP